ncbi:MAG: hypothetical protein GKR89_34590 [Candidatus Latescibacteria bacterium]|nr:hypothetical protein [Candidatus Latescibacterota bacterium]
MFYRRMDLHKLYKTALLAATGQASDNWLFLLNYSLRLLRVLVLLALWRIILAGRGPVGGMSLDQVLTYTLVAAAFADQLPPRTALQEALWDGSIANRFLRPVNLLAQFAAESVGLWAFNFCFFSLPLLAGAYWLGVNPWPASPAAGLAFLFSLTLSIGVGLALEVWFAALMIRMDGALHSVLKLREAMVPLLSGAFLPLALMPWGLGEIFTWLPFAAAASAPLRLYTGSGEVGPLLLLQAVWCLLLWGVARLLWSRERENLVIHGG